MSTVRCLTLGVVMAALSAGGCATARAKSQPEPASLEVPMPPPRVIVPPEPEPAAPSAPAPEPEPRQQKPVRRAAPARPDTRTDATRAKVPPEPPPAPVVEPVRPAVPPTATLQQALPAGQSETERHVRDQLSQASADLKRVDYEKLSVDAKSQYDTAKRFIEQAEQALKEKNLVFAAKVAEKAAGLAGSLVGR